MGIPFPPSTSVYGYELLLFSVSNVPKDEDTTYNLDTSLVIENPSSQQDEVSKSDQSDQCDCVQQEQIPSSDQRHHQKICPTLDPYYKKQCSMIPEDEESQEPEHSSSTVLEVGHVLRFHVSVLKSIIVLLFCRTQVLLQLRV